MGILNRFTLTEQFELFQDTILGRMLESS